MAYTTETLFTGNGSTTSYVFTFSYVKTTEVKVTINGTATTAWTFTGPQTILFTSAPANGAAIRIYRETQDSSLYSTFNSSAAIKSSDLNTNFKQLLQLVQEEEQLTANSINPDGSIPMTGNLNMGSNRIINLTTPTSSSDAATKQYVDTAVSGITIGDGDKGDIVISGSGANWTIDTGVVTGSKIAADTITSSNIAPNAVGSSELADGAVDTLAISLGAVTGNKIANATITADHLAADSVGTSQLVNGAVGTDEIADLAVTAAKIANDTITSAQIAADAVGSSELANSAVDSAAIAAGAVTGDKINASVTAMTNPMNMGGYKVTNLGTPTVATDAATKSYVDSASSSGISDGNKTDITVSGAGSVWIINDDAVSYGKIQNVSATDRLLGRSSAGSGNVEEIPCTSFARTLLDDTDAATARTTLGISSGNLTDGNKTDITVSGAGSVWIINDDAVTYAKIQNVTATDRILGRSSAGSGNVEEITCTSFARTLLDDIDADTARATLGISGGLTDGYKTDIVVSNAGAVWTIDTAAVTTTKIADDNVTYGKIQNVSATNRLLGRSSAGSGDIEEITCTPFARTLLDDIDDITARATLGISGVTLVNGDKGDISVNTTTTPSDTWTIDSGAVTEAKIGSDAVTEAKIKNGAVTQTKIADGAVVTAKIGAAQVTEEKLANYSVTNNILGNGSITNSKIANNQITGDKLVDSTITPAKVLGGVSALSGVTDIVVRDSSGNTDLTSINGSPIGGRRNKIINGCFRIDQRKKTTINAGEYGPDRWRYSASTTGVVTFTKDSTSVPDGFSNCGLVTVTTSDVSMGTSEYAIISQHIEGLNTADLAWGKSGAKFAYLSFWVRCSIAGIYCCSIRNNALDRSYVANYTINTANTWQKVTIPVFEITTGNWLVDSNTGLTVSFCLGSGTSFQTGSQNTWVTTNSIATSSQTNLLATLGATWRVTGVQFERGTAPTAFEINSFATEQVNCQRYFQKSYNIETAPGTTTQVGCLAGKKILAGDLATFFNVRYPVTMRDNGIVTWYNPVGGTVGQIRNSSLSTNITVTGTSSFEQISTNSPGSPTHAASGNAGDVITAHYTADAELT